MIRLILMLIVAGAITVSAQPAVSGDAKDYFNRGSATFIRENPEAALAVVNEGLQFYPEDEPLLKLKALLEQQNEQEQQQNQQDQQDQDQDQDDQQQDQQDQQSSQNQQNEENQDQEEEEENPDEQNEGQENQNNDEQAPAEQDQQEVPRPEQMSEEEAEMMLDSLKQLEQAQRDDLIKQMIEQQAGSMPPVEKDW